MGIIGVVIPAVKHRIKSFGRGEVLNSVLSYDGFLNVIKLVCHHIIGNGYPLLVDESRNVKCAIAKFEVFADVAKVA